LKFWKQPETPASDIFDGIEQAVLRHFHPQEPKQALGMGT
jgi:hypothetical protein